MAKVAKQLMSFLLFEGYLDDHLELSSNGISASQLYSAGSQLISLYHPPGGEQRVIFLPTC